MPKYRKRSVQRRIAGVLISLTLLPGCSSNPVTTSPQTIQAAQPADSPATVRIPAGVVRPLNGHPHSAIFDAGTSKLVVLSRGADAHEAATVTVFGAGRTGTRTVALPGPATALSGDGRGTAYLSTRGGYFVVDLSAGDAARVDIAGAEHTDFTAIAHRANGKLVLGSADGAVYSLASETTVAKRNDSFARVDSIVTQANTAIVLDRGQTSVTTIGPDGDVQQALRAGQGAATMAADPLGRVLVADTRGEELLVFGVDPLILRQAYPVRKAPYGLAGSAGLAWVSQTAANTVIGYDLSTGIPVEKVRYPTVQQPDSLAFDDASGTLYVVSSSGAGVQVIEHAAVPR